jgi:hypothetical protein
VGTDERERLYVVFTMDCLPPGEAGEVRGPGGWEEAVDAVVAFAEALADQGLGGTFFLAPQALARMDSAVETVTAKHGELALLCHPQLANYQTYLGAYSFERQREIIGTSRKVWERHLGWPPSTFRPGFFSANDHTFHALCMEGFRQGSCSLPGRMDNEQCSMWFRSYPFPHHADPLDRRIQGTMEFLEFPVTSDADSAVHLRSETYTPRHLRIEETDIHAYAEDLIERQLELMHDDDVLLNVLTFVTSNQVGWGHCHDPHVERLGNLCAMLREMADRHSVELCWKSMDELHAIWDAEYRAMRGLQVPG